MSISTEDLKLWNDFKKRCKKIVQETNNGICKSKDNSIVLKNYDNESTKKFLREIKLNTKLSNNNDLFVLKKGTSLGIDSNLDKKLLNGKIKIDYKIDLHGLTLEQAHNKLKLLFETAERNNFRCLLIITGKGLHSKDKTIKTSITEWFAEPIFANKIIKYVDAHVKDGGAGALYVLLRHKQHL